MDLQTSLLCLVLVLLSGGILFFIFNYGIKEKTYEEAIAEQRKMPNDKLLLQRPKDKFRYKKQKKEEKKVKKKAGANKTIRVNNSSNNSYNNNNNNSKVNNPLLAGSKTKLEKKETKHSDVHSLGPETEIINKSRLPSSYSEKKQEKNQIQQNLINKKESIVKEKSSKKKIRANELIDTNSKDDLHLKTIPSANNINSKNCNNEHTNLKKISVDKDFKAREKLGIQEPLTEITKVKSEKNKKIVSETLKSDEKSKEKKAKNDDGKKEKLANEKPKIVKSKMNEVKVENAVNNNKTKNENQQVQPKNKLERKLIKSNLNKNISDSSYERKPIQMKKISNQQQQLNNRDQKNKKRQNYEIFSLQQMVERDTININLLLPLIRKAELSRSEVQTLTDILLTSHLDEKTDRFEWIEGRQDPVVKLKKQLAEKEQALADEQQACQAFQNKLKELRSEYNSERARLSQACRQYEENILAKQGEIQNLHATNRHLIDNHIGEKQVLTQKIQQLQAQINDENIVIRKLQEDHNQTQSALQQELVNQGQQMEMHIGRLSEQLQEAQTNFEAQIHNKIQEAEQLRASFNSELQKNRRLEEELRELREQQAQNQSKIKSLETRTAQLKETSNHAQELVRQIEELQHANKDLEIRLNNSHKIEEELQFEKMKLQSEVHGFRNTILQLQNDCGSLRKEFEKLEKNRDKIKAAKDDLENSFLRIKEENQCLVSQVSSFTKLEKEALRLREENENLAAQVIAFTERPAADGRENGDYPHNEEQPENVNIAFINHESDKQKDTIIEKLLKELKEKEIHLEQLNFEKEKFNTEIMRLSNDASNYKTEIQKLSYELETQKDKNNDLRKKNWKAMEVLAATEKALEDCQTKAEKKMEIRIKECEELSRSLLERIFPSIKINEKMYENWLVEFENCAKSYLEQLSLPKETFFEFDVDQVKELETKNNQLLTSIAYYKTIIEDTEGMLKKLQSHIEQEEIRWRQRCETLEMEIQVLKSKLELVENTNEKEIKKEIANVNLSEETKEERNNRLDEGVQP